MADVDDMRRLREEVGKKELRKLRAKRRGDELWFGFGMFGLVGWSVALPTLMGIAVGVVVDRAWPGPISWTLTFLFVGIALGCLNAWYWVSRLRGGDD